MFRLVWPVALALTLLLAAALFVLRILPYDTRTLSQFVLPEAGCAAPCWHGIRPGMTSADAALDELHRHDWIDGIALDMNYLRADGWLNWQWANLPGDAPVMAANNSIRIDYNTVTSIRLSTRVQLGDLWLLLGTPDDVRRMQYGDQIFLSLTYDMESLFAQVELPCGAPAHAVWRAPVMLLWLKDIPPAAQPASFSTNRLTDCGTTGDTR